AGEHRGEVTARVRRHADVDSIWTTGLDLAVADLSPDSRQPGGVDSSLRPLDIRRRNDVKDPIVYPIVILDFGSQYTQLIARRIRELQVYSVIVPCHIPYPELLRLRPQALILSGGPSSVYDPASPKCDERLFKLEVPILGICYGLQFMAAKLGGRV